MARPSTTSWRWSWASTSATDTLNAFFSRSLMLRTTWRLSFRLRDPRTSNRTRREPTIILVRGPWSVAGKRVLVVLQRTTDKGLRQGSLHLLDAVGLDDVVDLD